MKNIFILFSILMVLSVGCSKTKIHPIEGKWYGESDDGMKQTFVFNEDGSATWILNSEMFNDTFYVKYKSYDEFSPRRLVIYDFKKGFLRDKSLYCIFRINEGTILKLDAEAGTSDNVRPENFGESTVTYNRVDK